MRDAMSFALHIRQAARGSRALRAMQFGGYEAFAAAMAEPLEELAAVYRDAPIYYLTNSFTVAGPDATVIWPRYSKVMDYELEIGIFTKRTRANIPAKRGLRAHPRLHNIQRLFRARPAGDRNAGPHRPRQGKELRRRQRPRALDRVAGRTRRSPRPSTLRFM
jgi:Fumarylacetoacetate (FAA) hydrolase family